MAYNHQIMIPENSPAVAPPAAGMGEFSRISGVFFDPKTAFADIAKRPTWIVPVVLVVVFGLLVSITIGQRVGWERVVRQSMENNSQVHQATPERREELVATYTRVFSIMAYTGVILLPLSFAIMAGVLLGVASGIFPRGFASNRSSRWSVIPA